MGVLLLLAGLQLHQHLVELSREERQPAPAGGCVPKLPAPLGGKRASTASLCVQHLKFFSRQGLCACCPLSSPWERGLGGGRRGRGSQTPAEREHSQGCWPAVLRELEGQIRAEAEAGEKGSQSRGLGQPPGPAARGGRRAGPRAHRTAVPLRVVLTTSHIP